MRVHSSTRTSASFWISLLIPLSAVGATQATGAGTLVTLGIFSLVLPLLDWVGGARCSEQASVLVAARASFSVLLVCFLPLQVAAIGLGLMRCKAGADWLPLLGISISCGLAGSVAIIAAHDLLHRPNGVARAVGNAIMSLVLYPHFGNFHRVGHHRDAATLEDPSTARLGEGFYSFFLRTVPGCFSASWSHEQKRLRRRGLSALHPSSALPQYVLVPLVLLITSLAVGGVRGALFFALQSIIAVAMLECVSYIQHYGLVREKLDNGRYAPMTPQHSWDCNARASNLFFLNLPLHAEHHASPQREYQDLVHHAEAPQLPAGYSTMIALALVPALWRRCMDWRVMVARRCHASTGYERPQVAPSQLIPEMDAMLSQTALWFPP